MPAVSKKLLLEWFPRDLDEASAAVLAKLLKESARDEHAAEAAMEFANDAIHGYGVEAIRGDYHVDNFHFDIVATYVNTGDTYNPTIIYETENERFLLTDWGTWVEKNEKKYRII
jgi:hypothetical protein